MTVAFWLSLFVIIYAYMGYPLALLLISRLREPKKTAPRADLPSVSLIVAVHNERERVEEKIQNCLRIDYPGDRLEVFFSSDASDDGTDEIVARHENRNVILVRSEERKGKEHAQRIAIRRAKGEIVVFTDVAAMLEPAGIRTIVSKFSDERIGCVSSEDRYVDENNRICPEGLYVRYEMFLRSLESRVYSVVGLSGSFFAARRALCEDWPTDIPSDFNTLLNAVRNGYRGVSDPESVGVYRSIADEKREFQRKVRTITRGISALAANSSMLNVFRYGVFSWQLISHKLLRWSVPMFMALLLISNILLVPRGWLYVLFLVGQAAFYLAAAAYGYGFTSISLFRVPYYFVTVNAAIAYAWYKYFRGQRFSTWTPTKR